MRRSRQRAVTQQEVETPYKPTRRRGDGERRPPRTWANARAGVSRTQADIERLQCRASDASQHRLDEGPLPITRGIAGIKNANIGDLIAASTRSPRSPSSTRSTSRSPSASRSICDGASVGTERLGTSSRPGDGTTYPHRGTAEILDRDVGRTTGTINLRGVFPNPGELLRPGSS